MPSATTIRKRNCQRGSALLMVIFFGAVMIVGASVATLSVLQQGKRDREEELIWRGEQYARAVKLFYRKNGRFPQRIEDLTKEQNNVRFLRRPYKDPMNDEDGSWRLIYVAPNGQLIGSVTRSNTLLQLPQRPTGTAAGTPTAGALAGAGGVTSGISATAPTQPGQPSTTFGSVLGGLGSGQIIGGNIIGVGSKVEKTSIKVYNQGSTYREWEFIWDPTQDAAVGQPGAGGQQPGTPAGQQPTTPRRP